MQTTINPAILDQEDLKRNLNGSDITVSSASIDNSEVDTSTAFVNPEGNPSTDESALIAYLLEKNPSFDPKASMPILLQAFLSEENYSTFIAKIENACKEQGSNSENAIKELEKLRTELTRETIDNVLAKTPRAPQDSAGVEESKESEDQNVIEASETVKLVSELLDAWQGNSAVSAAHENVEGIIDQLQAALHCQESSEIITNSALELIEHGLAANQLSKKAVEFLTTLTLNLEQELLNSAFEQLFAKVSNMASTPESVTDDNSHFLKTLLLLLTQVIEKQCDSGADILLIDKNFIDLHLLYQKTLSKHLCHLDQENQSQFKKEFNQWCRKVTAKLVDRSIESELQNIDLDPPQKTTILLNTQEYHFGSTISAVKAQLFIDSCNTFTPSNSDYANKYDRKECLNSYYHDIERGPESFDGFCDLTADQQIHIKSAFRQSLGTVYPSSPIITEQGAKNISKILRKFNSISANIIETTYTFHWQDPGFAQFYKKPEGGSAIQNPSEAIEAKFVCQYQLAGKDKPGLYLKSFDIRTNNPKLLFIIDPTIEHAKQYLEATNENQLVDRATERFLNLQQQMEVCQKTVFHRTTFNLEMLRLIEFIAAVTPRLTGGFSLSSAFYEACLSLVVTPENRLQDIAMVDFGTYPELITQFKQKAITCITERVNTVLNQFNPTQNERYFHEHYTAILDRLKQHPEEYLQQYKNIEWLLDLQKRFAEKGTAYANTHLMKGPSYGESYKAMQALMSFLKKGLTAKDKETLLTLKPNHFLFSTISLTRRGETDSNSPTQNSINGCLDDTNIYRGKLTSYLQEKLSENLTKTKQKFEKSIEELKKYPFDSELLMVQLKRLDSYRWESLTPQGLYDILKDLTPPGKRPQRDTLESAIFNLFKEKQQRGSTEKLIFQTLQSITQFLEARADYETFCQHKESTLEILEANMMSQVALPDECIKELMAAFLPENIDQPSQPQSTLEKVKLRYPNFKKEIDLFYLDPKFQDTFQEREKLFAQQIIPQFEKFSRNLVNHEAHHKASKKLKETIQTLCYDNLAQLSTHSLSSSACYHNTIRQLVTAMNEHRQTYTQTWVRKLVDDGTYFGDTYHIVEKTLFELSPAHKQAKEILSKLKQYSPTEKQWVDFKVQALRLCHSALSCTITAECQRLLNQLPELLKQNGLDNDHPTTSTCCLPLFSCFQSDQSRAQELAQSLKQDLEGLAPFITAR